MPIPGDFPDLLHDFAREILRDQPEDIYEYGAAYFKALEEVSSKPRTSCSLYCFLVRFILINSFFLGNRELNSIGTERARLFPLPVTVNPLWAPLRTCKKVPWNRRKMMRTNKNEQIDYLRGEAQQKHLYYKKKWRPIMKKVWKSSFWCLLLL